MQNDSTHWSVRTVAAETGISKTSVQRCFQLFGLQPYRTGSFKLSTDPPRFVHRYPHTAQMAAKLKSQDSQNTHRKR